MLSIARKKAQAEALSNLSFHIANAKALPFEANSFDVVTASKFLHLFPFVEKVQLTRELIRVVRPGGKLIIHFYTPFSAFRKMPGHALRGNFTYLRRRSSHILWPLQLRGAFQGSEDSTDTWYQVPIRWPTLSVGRR